MTGSHTYAEELVYHITVTLPNAYGSPYVGTPTATVLDATLGSTGMNIGATETQGFNGTVATFTDAGGAEPAGNYAATIDWGDGSSSTGTVVAQTSQPFLVTGQHVYAEERPPYNPYPISVTIADDGGQSTVAHGTAVVTEATLLANVVPFSATAGIWFHGNVATFTEASTESKDTFTVTINWGDGSSSTGVVDGSNGSFTVGTDATGHRYAAEGQYTVSVAISDDDGLRKTASGTLTVFGAKLSVTSTPISVNEGQRFTGTVATFTDAVGVEAADDFTATINWGDGTLTNGVVSGGPGSFTVSTDTNGHVYNDELLSRVDVQVSEDGSTANNAMSSFWFTVGEADSLSGAINPNIAPKEGAAVTGQVATFTSTYAGNTVGDFAAKINWGDSTPLSDGVVVGGNGSFTVYTDATGHTYPDEALYTLVVTVTDRWPGTARIDPSISFTVAENDTLTGAVDPLAPTEGVAVTGQVATFTSTYAGNTVGDFAAKINWGDGTQTDGVVVGGNGSFTVYTDSAGHTYAGEGTYPFSVTVKDKAPGTATVTINGTVTAAEGDVLTPGAASFSPTEGQAYTGQVATFTSAYPANSPADFTATINWGDGTITAGVVAGGGSNPFAVSAATGHLYAEEGAYPVTVTVQDNPPGSATVTINGTATVLEGDVLTGTFLPFSPTEGQAYAGQVATFRSTYAGNRSGDFTATIDWGDGTSSDGVVTAAAVGFTVSTLPAGHIYAEETGRAVTVTVSDKFPGTATVTLPGPVTVGDAPLSLSPNPLPLATTEGALFTGTAATFIDQGGAEDAGSYRATITWGDGATSRGVVVAQPGNAFLIIAEHAYAEQGTFPISITVLEDGDANTPGATTVTATSSAVVADAALSATGFAFNAFVGAPTDVVTVASFHDADPNATTDDFTARVDWGGGRVTAGVVTPDGQGGYNVGTRIAFAVEGPVAAHVTVTDVDGGQTASADAAGYVASVSAVEGQPFDGQVVRFSSAGAGAVPGAFAAVIDWGQGHQSSGTVVPDPVAGFDVLGQNTFANPGLQTLNVTVTNPDQTVTSFTVGAIVSDAPLTAYAETRGLTRGDAYSGVVATFVDGDPAKAVGNYAAGITWGDGSAPGTASVRAVTGSPGTFEVIAGHTYANPGLFVAHVTVADTTGGATPSAAAADSTFQVADLGAVEGQAFTGLLGSFTSAAVGPFQAEILWGDGSTSTVTPQPDGTTAGAFTITGGHTFAEEGVFLLTVTVTDAGGTVVTTLTPTVAVHDAALTVSATHSLSAVVGRPFTGDVGTFRDANPGATADDFRATVFWGDGLSSEERVRARPDGSFVVASGHTYAAAGSMNLTLRIDDRGKMVGTDQAAFTVAAAPLAVLGTAFVTAAGVEYRGTLGTLFDGDPAASPSRDTVRVNWGDASPEEYARLDWEGAGTFSVGGTHTFATPGTYTVTLTAAAGSTQAVGQTAANVGTLTATEGQPFNGVVATFASDPAGLTGPVTVRWANGQVTPGVVAPGRHGGFTVAGRYTYRAAGLYPLTVTAPGVGALSPTMAVADAALDAGGTLLVLAAGAAFTGVVASFSDENLTPPDGSYAVTIDWGDGTAVTGGTLASTGPGQFNVSGSHTYHAPDNYPISVTVTDPGGSSARATSSAVVSRGALTLTAAAVQATEGLAFNGTVATFLDAGASAPANSYGVEVQWDDGETSIGNLVAQGSGGFLVVASHTYALAGTYVFGVSVVDADGLAVTDRNAATVQDAPLYPPVGRTIAPTAGVAFDGVLGSFTDHNSLADAGGFRATIDWGDGTDPTDGTVLPNDALGFDVSGTHTYARLGSFRTSVGVTDLAGGRFLAIIGTANVTTFAATEGTSFTGVLGVFTTSGNGPTTARIDWGDNTPLQTVPVSAKPAGQYPVVGTHTYAEEGSYQIRISLWNSVQVGMLMPVTVYVGDAPLTASGALLTLATDHVFTGVIATFTDAGGSDVIDFTTQVDWGDGGSSANVSVTPNNNGGFNVVGTHTYTGEMRYAITVTVTDLGGASIKASGRADVARMVAVEGASYAAVVAVGTPPAGTAAVIDWGDQTATTPMMPSPDGFVRAAHTYAEDGFYDLSVTLTSAGAAPTVVQREVAVADAPLTATAVAASGTVGISSEYVVAEFTDANPNASPDEFTAQIVWGDGQTSDGAVFEDGSGNFSVAGSNVYALQGSFPFRVHVTDQGGVSFTVNATATLTAPEVVATFVPFAPLAGVAFTGVVATFTDANPAASQSAYSATVDWGDGEPIDAAATVRPKAGTPGTYEVVGTHTYAAVDPAVTVQITLTKKDVVTGTVLAIAPAEGTVAVTDPAIVVTVVPFQAVEGAAYDNTVATFTDANPNAVAGDFTVTVAWGDGETSEATAVSTGTGTFRVEGSHTYAEEGSFDVAVTVKDAAGGPADTDTHVAAATVSDAVLTAVSPSPTLTGEEHAVLDVVDLGTFTDANAAASDGDFTVSISWGDQSTPDTTTGQVVGDGTGSFAVLGTHIYANPGTYQVAWTVTDAGGKTVTATATAQIDPRAFAMTSKDFEAAVNVPTGDIVVAEFTQAYGTAADYTATVDWGDGGQPDPNARVQAKAGVPDTYEVVGGHTYAQAGTFAVHTVVAQGTTTHGGDGHAYVLGTLALTGGLRTNDPDRAQLLAIGEASVALNTGGLRLSEALNFDRSAGAAGGGTALVYNSNTVDVRPVIELHLDGAFPQTPTGIVVTLTWNGATPETTTFFMPPGNAVPNGGYLLAVQEANRVATSGIYAWSATVQLSFATAAPVTASTSGHAAVVVNDSADATPFGPGWGLAGIDHLVTTAVANDDVLWVTGAGDSRVFTYNAASGTYVNIEDFGTLTRNAATGGFTYVDKYQDRSQFDSNGLLTSVTDAHGFGPAYHYDASNRLDAVDTEDGGHTMLTYDANAGTVVITEPGDATHVRTVLLLLDSQGDLYQIDHEEIVAPNPATTVARRSFAYDANHHLTKDAWNPLVARFGYDPITGFLTAVDRGLGTITTIQPANVRGLPSEAQPVSVQGVAVVNTAYQFGSLSFGIPLTHTTSYTMDKRGRPLLVERPLSNADGWRRDEHGRVWVAFDPRQQPTIYTYDYSHGSDDLRQVEYADHSIQTYEYDPTLHRVTLEQGPLPGQVTRYEYNVYGDRTLTTDALGEATRYRYYGDAPFDDPTLDGLLKSVTDPANHTVSYQYDGSRRLRAVQTEVGRTTYTYDAWGNRATVLDALGYPTTTAYDSLGRLTRSTDAAGNATAWQYTDSGLTKQVTDPRQHHTVYEYDVRGWEKQVIEAADDRTVARLSTFAYDLAGNVKETVTGIGADARTDHRSTTTYGYDALDRRTSVTEAVGQDEERQTAFVYDPAGNVVSMTAGIATNPALNHAVTTVYNYDARDRRTAVYENWTQVGSSRFVKFDRLTVLKYDAAGNLKSTTTGLSSGRYGGNLASHPSTTTYQYDVLDRTTDVTEAVDTRWARTTHTTYDLAGNVQSVTTGLATNPAYAHPSTTLYAYDGVHRRIAAYEGAYLTLVNNVPFLFYTRLTTLAYDTVGNLTAVTTGLSNVTTAHPAVTVYQYDALGRRIVTAENFSVQTLVTPLGTVTLPTFDRATVTAYDENGNVVAMTTGLSTNLQIHAATTTYAYDALNRRTDVREGVFSADARLAHTTYDAADNVKKLVTGIKESDPKLLQQLGETSYEYDALNRQTEARAVVGGGAQDRRTRMTYDAADNVLTRVQYTTATTGPRLVVTIYDYDALNHRTALVEDQHPTRALFGWSEDVQRRSEFVYDAAGDLVAQTTGQAAAGLNAVGTNIAYARPVQTEYHYDALGRRTDTIEAVGNNRDQRWTVLTYDAADNLVAVTKWAPANNPEQASVLVTEVVFDAVNRATAVVETALVGQGNVRTVLRTTTTAYDGANNVIDTVNPLGIRTHSAYDGLNERVAVTEGIKPPPDGTPPTPDVQRTTRFTYDAAGNLTDFIAPRQYDHQQSLTADWTVDGPATVTTHYAYDSLNRRTDTWEAWGIFNLQRHAFVTYDTANNVRSTTSGVGNPLAGLINNITYSHPVVSTYVYDGLNRLTARTDTLDASDNVTRIRRTSYDGFGNVEATWVGKEDSKLARLSYRYDALGRRVQSDQQPVSIVGISITGGYTQYFSKNLVLPRQIRFSHIIARPRNGCEGV